MTRLDVQQLECDLTASHVYELQTSAAKYGLNTMRATVYKRAVRTRDHCCCLAFLAPPLPPPNARQMRPELGAERSADGASNY